MRLLMGLIAMLLFASCVTRKKCADRYPPQIVSKDSVIERETVSYRDTTILVPGDRVHMTDTIPCPDVVYKKTVTSKTGRTKASVTIDRGKLNVDCKTDSLQATIDSLKTIIREKEKYATQTITIEVPVIKYKIPGWIWLLLLGCLAALVIAYRIPIFKIIKNIIMKWLTVVLCIFLFSCSNKPDNTYYPDKYNPEYGIIKMTPSQGYYYAIKDGHALVMIIAIIIVIAAVLLMIAARRYYLGENPGRYMNYVMFVLLGSALLMFTYKPGDIWLNNDKPVKKTLYDYHMKKEGSTVAIWDSLYNVNRIIGVKPPKK